MEAKGNLRQRLERLEAVTGGDGCQTCAARGVFTLADPGAKIAPCPECGRLPFLFSIDIDRAERREGDAA